ncbi:hypothetical protein GGI15_003251 [Coemansia interrupta]|uniref:Carbohydrate-binding module family 96 domain-containing protein n=1 Tax=Coemansia interrupta TaxID=1126814 RepID=A0A9W8LJ52_9FUNG|nr:hypothetical protein GGI15_003251 [Coemansia interrupta]
MYRLGYVRLILSLFALFVLGVLASEDVSAPGVGSDSIDPTRGSTFDTPATKDSTINRATIACHDCPDSDCFKCTLGKNATVVAYTGTNINISALIGFDMSVDGSSVKSCNIQIPAFTDLPQSDITVIISKAAPTDWNEDTVTGKNAPAVSAQIASVVVPALNNLGPVDITPACQGAVDGKFSVYFSAKSGRYEFWARDWGSPAILHVTKV